MADKPLERRFTGTTERHDSVLNGHESEGYRFYLVPNRFYAQGIIAPPHVFINFRNYKTVLRITSHVLILSCFCFTVYANDPSDGLTLNTYSLDFGYEAFVAQSISGEVILTFSAGWAGFVDPPMLIVGPNASDFRFVNNCAHVPQDTSCTVSVTFTPSGRT